MPIKILKETKDEIVGEIEKIEEKFEKVSKKSSVKKYKIDSISETRIVLVDDAGIGRILPILGNEHLKINDEIELPE